MNAEDARWWAHQGRDEARRGWPFQEGKDWALDSGGPNAAAAFELGYMNALDTRLGALLARALGTQKPPAAAAWRRRSA